MWRRPLIRTREADRRLASYRRRPSTVQQSACRQINVFNVRTVLLSTMDTVYVRVTQAHHYVHFHCHFEFTRARVCFRKQISPRHVGPFERD